MFLDFNLRFNLRQTKQNKPTIIYAVFVWQGVQYKVNTLLKVYPSQWDNKTQTATISNRLSKLDNHNNKIANQKITSIYSKFIDKKHYLCNKLEADIVKEISAIINPISKTKPRVRHLINVKEPHFLHFDARGNSFCCSERACFSVFVTKLTRSCSFNK